MGVMPGYKQTEIGVIPIDWDLKRLDSLADIRSGGTPSTNEPAFWNGVVPWATPTDITALKGGKYLSETSRTITRDGLNNSSAELIPANSILMTSRATIGECAINKVQVTTNQGFKNFVPRAVDVDFLYYLLGSHKRSFLGLCGGSTFLEIGKTQLAPYQVGIPAMLEEQRTIARALSDVDALLVTLDQVIEKKRDIREASMQQLLAGETRLPGFVGEWLNKDLSNTATLKARIGWQGLTTAEYLDSGDYLLVTGTDFKNSNIDWNNCHYVTEDRYCQDENIQLQINDVLVTKDGTIGKVALISELPSPATLNSGVFVIRPIRDAFHPRFFYYLLCSKVFTEFLSQLCAGSTISHLYQKDFITFKYKIPPTLSEQISIANVLFDMDAELSAIEIRREKIRNLKLAMIDELLTGKTRLTSKEDINA